MPKSAFTEAHGILVGELVSLRKRMGVSQVELATRLGKRQQFVSLIENGVRRIDVLEFYAIARALGADPREAFAAVANRLPDQIEI